MVAIKYTGDELWNRIERARVKAKQLLLRVVDALEATRINYLVAGKLAVQLWVSTVDEAANRNARDVDIVLARHDLAIAIEALSDRGFIHCPVLGAEYFFDAQSAERARVHLSSESAVPEDFAPKLNQWTIIEGMRVINLEPLVRMKLASFRLLDKVNLRDLLDVALIDPTWLPRFPDDLRKRLQELIDTPNG
jgi:hypothetical protein